MEELIQVVDDNDEPVRGASLDDIHKHGLRYRVVYALIRDRQGRLLVQLRGSHADDYPDCWGVSAAGYVYENERYDVAVMRKLAEELGLSNLELREIDTYTSEAPWQERTLRQCNKVFGAEVAADTELRTDPRQVAELRWLDGKELRDLIDTQPEAVTPGLRAVLERQQ